MCKKWATFPHECWLRLGKAAASIYDALSAKEPRSARRVAAVAGSAGPPVISNSPSWPATTWPSSAKPGG